MITIIKTHTGVEIHTGEKFPVRFNVDLEKIHSEGIEAWETFVSHENTNRDVQTIAHNLGDYPQIVPHVVNSYMEQQNVVKQWIAKSKSEVVK